jgi:hypothetical protein
MCIVRRQQGLAIWHLLVCVLVLAGCRSGVQNPAAAGCVLPVSTGNDGPRDNGLLLELPAGDTAFIGNGMRIEPGDLDAVITTVFAQLRPGRRAFFVLPVPTDRCKDVRRVAAIAERHGGRAFDAKASGWLGQDSMSIIVVPADADLDTMQIR